MQSVAIAATAGVIVFTLSGCGTGSTCDADAVAKASACLAENPAVVDPFASDQDKMYDVLCESFKKQFQCCSGGCCEQSFKDGLKQAMDAAFASRDKKCDATFASSADDASEDNDQDAASAPPTDNATKNIDPEAPPTDSSLFIGPFYKLNDEQDSDGAQRFREAYCEARHIANTESFAHVFNTAVTSKPQSDAGVYFTREEFTDGEAFNLHIENVSDVFSRALGVASPTGFCALGTQADLDAISSFTEKNNVTTFVKDPRSFKRHQFKQERYFALDFFLTLNATDLPFFEKAWGETRDLAATFPGILAFAMGVHKGSDGFVTVECQETFADASAYEDWLPRAAKHADALFSVASLSFHPNPLSMTGTTKELKQMYEHCQELGCVQYVFDDCEFDLVVV